MYSRHAQRITPGNKVKLEKRREAGPNFGFSFHLRPSNAGLRVTSRETCTSASGNPRFSFFLSVWKDGVPQGRHRLYCHLFQLHHRRSRERQRQRRLRRFSREASADRWPRECCSVSSGPRRERSSQPRPTRRTFQHSPRRAWCGWAKVFP